MKAGIRVIAGGCRSVNPGMIRNKKHPGFSPQDSLMAYLCRHKPKQWNTV